MYKRLLIATDGSELAQKGVDHGLALAQQLGAEIVVVTVSEPIVTGFDDALGWGGANSLSSEYQKSQDDSAHKVLEQVRAKAECSNHQFDRPCSTSRQCLGGSRATDRAACVDATGRQCRWSCASRRARILALRDQAPFRARR